MNLLKRFILKSKAKAIRHYKNKHSIIVFRCSSGDFRWAASNDRLTVRFTVFSDSKLFAVMLCARRVNHE